jgi:hypothetical protein
MLETPKVLKNLRGLYFLKNSVKIAGQFDKLARIG